MLKKRKELLRVKLRRDLDSSDTSSADRLLDVLGCIPLAITQTGAFINRNKMNIQTYLTALERNDQNLMDLLSQELQDSRRQRGFPNSVF